MKMFRLGVLFVLCSLFFSPLFGDTLNKARRITGHYAPNSNASWIMVDEWDPDSEEARKFMESMEKEPSRLFRDRPFAGNLVEKLEHLEDIVYDMHLNLEPSRNIQLGDQVTPEIIDKWLAKLNTLHYLYAMVQKTKAGHRLYVYYYTDAKVFAAFRNPKNEKILNDKERELLDVCAQWISSAIQPGMPNMLKIRLVHDALVDNSRYTSGYHDTYNIVVNGKGVCSAYTSATQLLLHMLKIDCRSVRGTPEMNHIWNIIDVNGEWYQTDVTWDDPLSSKGEDTKVFSYYLLTEAEMEMDHQWKEREKYPVTPEVNRMGIFKRHAHRESMKDADEDETLTQPREKESIFKQMDDRLALAIEEQGDKAIKTVEPVTTPLGEVGGRAAGGAAKTLKSLIPSEKREKSEKPDYKPMSSLDDLYHNLGICREYLDGPTIELPVKSTCPCFIRQLMTADYYHFIKNWNFRYDGKKKILFLDLEHWPYNRLLQAANNEEMEAELTAEERATLKMVRAMVDKYGTAWKLEKQKIRDVYSSLIAETAWLRGPSDVIKAVQKKESGSLGYSETLHTVLTLMDIPCIMVHGRSHTDAHAWNMVRRSSGKWYHASAGFDDFKGNTREQLYKYFMRCDDEVVKELVWDTDETYPTPVKNGKRAEKYGLLNRKKNPEHAPKPDTKDSSPLPAMKL
ncbi:MAG: hypothetical protein J6R92_00180 [Akkermansia sp.]|nr:hypothetical protein [Akkermansia sp.]